MKIVTQRQKAQAKAMLSYNAAGNPAQPADAKNTLQSTMQKIACGAAVTLCLALTPGLVHGASPYQPEGAAGYPGIVIPDPEAPKVRRTHGVPGYPNEDLNAVAPSSPTHMIEEIPGRGAISSPPPAGYTQPQIATPMNPMETDIALPDSTYPSQAPAYDTAPAPAYNAAPAPAYDAAPAYNAAPAPAYSADPAYPGIVMPDPAAPKVRRTHGVPGYPSEDLNAVAPSSPTTTHQDGPAPAVLPSSGAAQPAPVLYQPAPAPQPYQPEPIAPAPYQPEPAPQPYQPEPVAPAPQPYQPAQTPPSYQSAPELAPYPVNTQPQPYPANPEPAPYPVAPQSDQSAPQPSVQPYPSGGEGDMGGNPGANPVPVDNGQ